MSIPSPGPVTVPGTFADGAPPETACVAAPIDGFNSSFMIQAFSQFLSARSGGLLVRSPAILSKLTKARRSVLLISSCTLISAAAQILIKIGVNGVTKVDPIALASNLPLVAGYALYGIFCLMMILALREGELSLLYPIISLAYVWVTVASYFIFHDTINPLKLTGIVTIMFGVAMLGRGPK
jgi:multidrug transporter EmrE-like cation transporter